MKRVNILRIVSLAVAAGCEQAPALDSPAPAAMPPAAMRAVDYNFPAEPLPPNATVSVDQNRRLITPKAADGRVAAATSYQAGPLQVKIWSCNNWPPEAHPVVQCTVDPDYVLVGGGAWATTSGPGAFLTASFPADPSVLRTWEGRSKDHAISDPHLLITYAIGLKIAGVSRSTLLGSAFVNRKTSGLSSRPGASAAFFPSDVMQTSDGCMIDWHGPGNMLTACEPVLGASGKEHGWADPATITTIGLGSSGTFPVWANWRTTCFRHSLLLAKEPGRRGRLTKPIGFRRESQPRTTTSLASVVC